LHPAVSSGTFRFAYPMLLFLLAAVAGWGILVVRREPAALAHSLTARIALLAAKGWRLTGKVPSALRALCLVFLVVAASRPQLFSVSREVLSPGVDIMLCMDTSGSMEAMDFRLDGRPVSRLGAAKKVVSDFVEKREKDRIGLVVFGERAYTRCPLTTDKRLLFELVKTMEVGVAGDRTAIGSALAVGGKRLKDLKSKAKILILLTDGRNNAGDVSPEEAAEALRALGIKIYAIGVGGKGPAPFPVETVFGRTTVQRRVDLDEETLARVASIGGGKYYRAVDSQGLSEIYSAIDREEKTEVKVKEFHHVRELYRYFLVAALFLLGTEVFLTSTFLRVLP
jgi:Ca-activated chloride channel family protein